MKPREEEVRDHCRGRDYCGTRCSVKHAKYGCERCGKPLCGTHLKRPKQHKCKKKWREAHPLVKGAA